MILNFFKDLGESSHGDWYLLSEMLSTVHVLKDVSRYIEHVSVGIFDSDSLWLDSGDLKVCSLREDLIGSELLGVPESWSGPFDLLDNR